MFFLSSVERAERTFNSIQQVALIFYSSRFSLRIYVNERVIGANRVGFSRQFLWKNCNLQEFPQTTIYKKTFENVRITIFKKIFSHELMLKTK